MISKGSLLVLASQVIAVVVHSLAKFLETSDDVNPQQILQVRTFVTLSINSLFLATWRPHELPLGGYEIRGLLTLRALGGILGSAGFYYSLQYLPLADATILNLLAPLGTTFVTSERIKPTHIGSAIVCLLGVCLISKPSFVINLLFQDTGNRYLDFSRSPHSSQRGFIFAIVGVLGGICSYTSIEKIGARAHPLVTANCFAAGILLASSACFAIVPGVTYNFNMSFSRWFILLSIGLCGTLMASSKKSFQHLEYFLTAGLAAEKESIAVYMIYLQAVLALIVDGLIWHTIPDAMSFLGAGLVIVALFITERSKEKVEDLTIIEMRFQNVEP
ncbi:hypothetical protein OIDMADRAFT_59340 [Oidiodendron maius Zn]|uniref:EamA domain-containing protein n=1 Tax=Oidiodendron maius (strain Zn) TaxID=913774 RepID=A0A0C3C9F7_OIDMZ|nr:hypothetical protein OIDMADRAFT_59340 [Oidiodendron maius Zn]